MSLSTFIALFTLVGDGYSAHITHHSFIFVFTDFMSFVMFMVELLLDHFMEASFATYCAVCDVYMYLWRVLIAMFLLTVFVFI